MPEWLVVLIAVLMAVVIWRVGIGVVRSFSRPAGAADGPDVPEDVEDLAVSFVCGECGTEYRVTKLGALQVPRHCGEPMLVVRRPATP